MRPDLIIACEATQQNMEHGWKWYCHIQERNHTHTHTQGHAHKLSVAPLYLHHLCTHVPCHSKIAQGAFIYVYIYILTHLQTSQPLFQHHGSWKGRKIGASSVGQLFCLHREGCQRRQWWVNVETCHGAASLQSQFSPRPDFSVCKRCVHPSIWWWSRVIDILVVFYCGWLHQLSKYASSYRYTGWPDQ